MSSNQNKIKLKLIAAQANRFKERKSSKFFFPPLQLGILAAYTPERYEITIVDEAIQNDPLVKDPGVDLVGISAVTCTAKRGYEIADYYKAHHIPVVMGGHHASALPEEALEHADAVVIGEADMVWAQVLADFEAGKMKGIYKAKEFTDMKDFPMAKTELYPKEARYLTRCNIHISRGCPHNCTFCSATRFWGTKFRKREAEQVIAEIKYIKENFMDESNLIHFGDDNLTVSKSYMKNLFKLMEPLNVRWQGNAGIDIVNDKELLELCKESGCIGLLIGFDSLCTENLNALDKQVNLKYNYIETVRIIQEEFGIPVIAAMIFGFDGDTTATFNDFIEFVEESHVATVVCNVLYPYPGTPIYDQFKSEGRITSYDWDNYVMDGVNFIPAKMTQEDLHTGYIEVSKRLSADEAIKRRADYAEKTRMGSMGAEMIRKWGAGLQRHCTECLLGNNQIRKPLR
jgi:radical SAM superfamily enzyme YgiQ (UPF0313 family)